MFVRHFTFTHSESVKHNRFSKCFSEHKVSGLKNRDCFHLWTRRHNQFLLLLCLFVTSLLPIVKSCEIVKHNRFSKCFSEHKVSGLKKRDMCNGGAVAAFRCAMRLKGPKCWRSAGHTFGALSWRHEMHVWWFTSFGGSLQVTSFCFLGNHVHCLLHDLSQNTSVTQASNHHCTWHPECCDS